jgi:hypothetical protein
MSDKTGIQEPEEVKDFLIAEFSSLREEILKRIEIQHQLITLALIATGTIIPLGIQSSTIIILAYPLLAMFISVAWSHSDRRIRHISAYIMCIEDKLLGGNRGWEHMQGLIVRERFGKRLLYASRGIFIGTQILSIVLALLQKNIKNFSTGEYVLALLDIVSIIITVFLLRRYQAQKGLLTLDKLY